MKHWLGVLLAAWALTSPVFAEETLAQWAESITTHDTQYKILRLLYPGIPSASQGTAESPSDGVLFPKNESASEWVGLNSEYVWMAGEPGRTPMLLITVLIRKSKDKAPYGATSYILRGTDRRPIAISDGLAGREHVRLLEVASLKKTFLILERLSFTNRGEIASKTAELYTIDLQQGGADALRSVWRSRPTFRYFYIGFAELHPGSPEDLVIKVAPPRAEPAQATAPDVWGNTSNGDSLRYNAFRWTNDRFELDDNVFDSQLRSLPETTWQQ